MCFPVTIRSGRSAERHFGKVQNIIIQVDDQDITSQDDEPGFGKMNIVIKDNEIIVGDIFIPEKYRKQGIATVVYQKISDYFGLPIVNSTTKGFNQTLEGGYIWKKRDRFEPRSLQEHIKRVLNEESKKKDFEIKSIKIINGRNKWSESKTKLVHMVLNIGKYENLPSNKIPNFYTNLKKYLPSLNSHRCSIGKQGGFFQRVKEGTWMGHIIEHVALELQTLAKMKTGWGRTRMVKGKKGLYNVVFNFTNEDCGKLAAKEAVNVVKNIIDEKDPNIKKIVQNLKNLKNKQLEENYKSQQNIKKVLKESYTDKMIRLIDKYMKTFYPNFNSKDVGSNVYDTRSGNYVVYFFDPSNDFDYATYREYEKELQLNREIFDSLEGQFGNRMDIS